MSEGVHEDPIVNEVRAVRNSIAQECNYDARALFERIKAHEKASGRKFVNHPPVRIDPAQGAAEGAA